MPYLLISARALLETGPTTCGDSDADPKLMKHCQAELKQELGNTFKTFVSPLCPRKVLDRLEEKGYKVISQSGPGQTCVWTLHKPSV
eukprot:m.72158 g.72158  ORF g.72158 m.72158 type:complete len:87 (+) comp20222_c0_seq1:57-317(+)